MPRLSQADLIELNRTFDDRTPAELLQWAKSIFGDRVAALTSMQESGNVICHMLHSIPIDMPLVFVDTGVLFQETLDTRDRLAAAYGLDIRTLKPKLTMEEQTEKYGVLYLSPDGQKQCCEMRKSEPLDAVKGEFDALIGSLRRADGGRREGCPILAVDTRLNLLRSILWPIYKRADGRVHQQESGDPESAPQTRLLNNWLQPLHHSVLPGEPKRAGRWRHLGPWSVYCGINPTDLDPERSPAVDFSQDLVDRILGRTTDFMI